MEQQLQARPEIVRCRNCGSVVHSTVDPEKLLKFIKTDGLSSRARRILARSRARTYGELVRMTQTEVLRMRGCGSVTLDELVNLLKSEDLYFGIRDVEMDIAKGISS